MLNVIKIFASLFRVKYRNQEPKGVPEGEPKTFQHGPSLYISTWREDLSFIEVMQSEYSFEVIGRKTESESRSVYDREEHIVSYSYIVEWERFELRNKDFTFSCRLGRREVTIFLTGNTTYDDGLVEIYKLYNKIHFKFAGRFALPKEELLDALKVREPFIQYKLASPHDENMKNLTYNLKGKNVGQVEMEISVVDNQDERPNWVYIDVHVPQKLLSDYPNWEEATILKDIQKSFSSTPGIEFMPAP